MQQDDGLARLRPHVIAIGTEQHGLEQRSLQLGVVGRQQRVELRRQHVDLVAKDIGGRDVGGRCAETTARVLPEQRPRPFDHLG